MAIEQWLEGLPGEDGDHVAGDLAALPAASCPLMAPEAVGRQVAALSRHLGHLTRDHRRAVIGYSLYARQLDAVQERTIRDICRADCERPPLGCCNQSHYQVLSMSDCLFSRPSPLAMRLAQSIGELQRSEDAFRRRPDEPAGQGPCRYFSPSGCTLRLFKSPLCLHYLCGKVETALRGAFAGRAEGFIVWMGAMAKTTILAAADFASPEVIDAAALLISSSV